MASDKSTIILLAYFGLLFFVSMFLLGWLLSPFLSTLALAFVAAAMFHPVYAWLAGRMRPPLASVSTCAIIFMVVFVPIVLFAGILANEALSLYNLGREADYLEQARQFLDDSRIVERITVFLSHYGVNLTTRDVLSAAMDLGNALGGTLYDQAAGVVSNILKFFVNFAFMLLVVYFMLMDGHRLLAYIRSLSPLPEEQDQKIMNKFKQMTGAVVLGNGVCGAIQGVLGGAAFMAAGISSAFLWGVIMGILAFLPIVGVGAVMVPGGLWLILKGRLLAGLLILGVYPLLSFSVEYLLKPRLVGNRAEMHPLLVFLAIIGGLHLFGILGVIYGPLVATFFITLTDIYQASYRHYLVPASQGQNPPPDAQIAAAPRK
ncbi:MAG: AI-2E family transporter [Deltaproteobacteria bacterium]|nr:AI-2E family transporter [Deltaproteobacteria bacterium]